jgi:hypothetical protein
MGEKLKSGEMDFMDEVNFMDEVDWVDWGMDL